MSEIDRRRVSHPTVYVRGSVLAHHYALVGAGFGPNIDPAQCFHTMKEKKSDFFTQPDKFPRDDTIHYYQIPDSVIITDNVENQSIF